MEMILDGKFIGLMKRKLPNVRAYRGMRVVKRKFGNYFELDLKDDDTEKFFKILGEQLQSLAGAYLNEKAWNLKSPIVVVK